MTAPTLSAPGVIDITATSARPQVTLTYVTAIATGGTVVEYNDGTSDWIAHIFDASDDFIVNTAVDVEYLVLAGGGSGGGQGYSGGGGAGGYRSSVQTETSGANSTAEAVKSMSPGTYPVVVGAGAPGTTSGASLATSRLATDSSFDGIVAIAGGSGGCHNGGFRDGDDGGSGGGAGRENGSGGIGTVNQGNNGASAGGITNATGGGGGASAAGTAGDGTIGGNGGDGLQSAITGTLIWYAGGGAGNIEGTHGQGSAALGSHAPANSGSGSSGGNSEDNGGSGKVVIRYLAP